MRNIDFSASIDPTELYRSDPAPGQEYRVYMIEKIAEIWSWLDRSHKHRAPYFHVKYSVLRIFTFKKILQVFEFSYETFREI